MNLKGQKRFMTLRRIQWLLLASLFIIYSCEEKKTTPDKPKKIVIKRVKPEKDISYIFVKTSAYLKQQKPSQKEWEIFCAVNRADSAHVAKMDSILVPSDLNADIAYYLPFPLTVPSLNEISKIIFFSYPAQAFGAYEYGQLVYTGATNMGRKADPTPTGLFFTNWKAEETKSTFNDEWELKWNFNIENKEGVGWHEYEMPGYPASHSCLRLQEKDARYLYDWADQWVLQNADSIKQKGTPVVVFGSYPFDDTKPWYQLINNPHALDINADEINSLVKPHMNEILEVQRKRL